MPYRGDNLRKASALCAASAPVFSDFTMKAASSVEAWKVLPANSNSVVLFSITPP